MLNPASAAAISMPKPGYLFRLLLALILTSSLLNSDLFIYPSLTAYYSFLIGIALFLIAAGITLLIKKRPARANLSLPSIFILAFTLYVFLHALFDKNGLGFQHVYLIAGGLFLLALTGSLHTNTIRPTYIFKIITLLSLFEIAIVVLQYVGWMNSHNPFFRITGSWSNPNVTAMFLAMTIPATVALFLENNGWTKKIAGGTLLFGLLTLILLECRTAFIGTALAAVIMFNTRYKFTTFLLRKKRSGLTILVLIGTLCILLAASFYTYKYKQASADGRRLIWKISAEMISQHPLTGVGYGLFEPAYNQQQAAQFHNGSLTPKEIEQATFTRMAYNELLENTVEGGLIGAVLLIGLLASLLIPAVPGKNTASVASRTAAYAGIAAFTIMSLFNFTIQAIPVLCLFLVYAAIRITALPIISIHILPIPPLILRSLPAILLIATGACLLLTQSSSARANWQTRQASLLIKQKEYNEALELLRPLDNQLSGSEGYWRTYALALMANKDYRSALAKLDNAKQLTLDPDLLLQTGLCYEILGQYSNAEDQYTLAANIEPRRLTPRFARMKLLLRTKDTADALSIAHEIVAISPKIPSAKAIAYKDEALKILRIAGPGPSLTGIPIQVEIVLKKAGPNRMQLEKAIAHYPSTGDSLKRKALFFLIANMDIHYSQSYHWVDSSGKSVNFNELDYPNFESAAAAFQKLKIKTPNIHPVPTAYRDIDSITADLLIQNIDEAFAAWRKGRSKNIPFEDFCEYILPYRISIEPLQNWREKYNHRFAGLGDNSHGHTNKEALTYYGQDIHNWFTNTYNIEQRKEPLPRLGALQLLHRKKGACEDVADLAVFTLRSQGIPATIDEIPFWATNTGAHVTDNTFDEQMRPIPFDASSINIKIDNKFDREPAKVIRITYSRQPNTLAGLVTEEQIPAGFMKTANYKDVTKEYWPVRDIACPLYPSFADRRRYPTSTDRKIAYLCVFNAMNWCPAWWSRTSNDSALFTDMCRGAAFLPTWYRNGKLQSAGHIILSGYNNELELIPDTIHRRSIRIAEQDKFLLYRPGKKYCLYYWDNAWKLSGEKKTGDNPKELVFDNVPRNVLLFLKPEYSQGKERPFTVDNDDHRLWW